MATYAVEISSRARKQIASFPLDVQDRIRAAIGPLAEEPRPRGAVKLAGTGSLWRIRVGVYRILYEVRDRQLLVLVIEAGHRREVYRRLV